MTSGSAESTEPTGKNARHLNADQRPFDRQPGESSRAYAAFVKFRDSTERKVSDQGGSAFRWSAEWSWGYRAYEYDLFMAEADLKDQVRFRREMHDRHRRMARLAQSKVVEWLMTQSPSGLSSSEAARWFESAVRVERAANGSDLPGTSEGDRPQQGPAESLADVFGLPPEQEAALARLLHAGVPRAIDPEE
ncbi:hypothetical protein [Kribbella italica]|uniref:Uncharacterized protein n=1 Tax=Kribbella italica TaxID=1540520 RepID=A0A7W9J2X3_9ACTN|nr:hypothetical protein [Kribbella italica]MBB5834380.1 hypothetical protein [Kribbella italica]